MAPDEATESTRRAAITLGTAFAISLVRAKKATLQLQHTQLEHRHEVVRKYVKVVQRQRDGSRRQRDGLMLDKQDLQLKITALQQQVAQQQVQLHGQHLAATSGAVRHGVEIGLLLVHLQQIQESNRRKQEQYAVEAAQNQRRSESLEHELHIRQSQLKDRERHIHSQDNVIACLQVSAQEQQELMQRLNKRHTDEVRNLEQQLLGRQAKLLKERGDFHDLMALLHGGTEEANAIVAAQDPNVANHGVAQSMEQAQQLQGHADDQMVAGGDGLQANSIHESPEGDLADSLARSTS